MQDFVLECFADLMAEADLMGILDYVLEMLIDE